MGLLTGKRGIVFGALDENSIAWHVAERCVEEGATIVLTNAPVAMRFGKIFELGKKLNAEVIPADVTLAEDLINLLDNWDHQIDMGHLSFHRHLQAELFLQCRLI